MSPQVKASRRAHGNRSSFTRACHSFPALSPSPRNVFPAFTLVQTASGSGLVVTGCVCAESWSERLLSYLRAFHLFLLEMFWPLTSGKKAFPAKSSWASAAHAPEKPRLHVPSHALFLVHLSHPASVSWLLSPDVQTGVLTNEVALCSSALGRWGEWSQFKAQVHYLYLPKATGNQSSANRDYVRRTTITVWLTEPSNIYTVVGSWSTALKTSQASSCMTVNTTVT